MTDKQPEGNFNNLIDPEAVEWFDKASKHIDHQHHRRRVAKQIAGRPIGALRQPFNKHPLVSLGGAIILGVGGVVALEVHQSREDNAVAQESARNNEITAVQLVMGNPAQLTGMGVCPDALRNEGQLSGEQADILFYDRAADTEQRTHLPCSWGASGNETVVSILIGGAPTKVTPADILPRTSGQPALF